ncbi:MAG: biotin--[acetyl-CoA-carboxylase] ligase [Gemmatimonadetes bacterium]|nr:biotin--[acetyl-CoA-carboxylase] ligase [Gemmatimonadota bacterium]
MADWRFDGFDAAGLAAHLALPACELHERVGSTMDVAHAAAERGAPAGTLILADAQDAGRGRGGKRWASLPGRGLWMTLIERPQSPRGLEVLSLRIGLLLADALDPVAGGRVGLKWPNDLFVAGRKLAGTLVEARWRDQRVEWIAIGIGLNVTVPHGVEEAAGMAPGTTRLAALERVMPALRVAAQGEGPLTDGEVERFMARDISIGRRVVQPAVGVVAGISAAGELMVNTGAACVACRSGSLVFAEEE